MLFLGCVYSTSLSRHTDAAKLVTFCLNPARDNRGMAMHKRRFLETSTATSTFIGPQSVFVGDIRGVGHYVVSGEVRGDGDIRGGLHLSATGKWHGFIRAEAAIIAGEINGGLVVKDKLEIGSTAVIRGKVSARSVAIAKGAIVDGEIEITSDQPVTEFEERRVDTAAP